MTKAEQFEALALRCEQATGPDRELDLAIYLMCNPDSEIARWVRNHPRGFDGKPGHAWELRETNLLFEGRNERGDCFHNGGIPLPKYTASLDATLRLVPEGMRPSVGQNVHHGYWHAFVQSIVDSTPHQLGVADSNTSGALALCAAALRARAQMERGK
jgi:hypothetical protein